MTAQDISATSSESPSGLIKKLIRLRTLARLSIQTMQAARSAKRRLEKWKKDASDSASQDQVQGWDEQIARCDELILDARFRQIEVGQNFKVMAKELDAKVPRELIFEALGVNRSLWDSDEVLEHDHNIVELVFVLNLENSATKDQGIEFRPLNWCLHRAVMHAIKTNPEMDRAAHDAMNEVFNGYWGEYKEPSLTSRLTGVGT